MKTTKDYICSEVFKTCVEAKSMADWKSIRDRIYSQMQSLKPDKPADGSVNYISFNVIGKDRLKLRTGKFLARKLELNCGFLNDQTLQGLSDRINTELYGSQSLIIKLLTGSAITQAYEDGIGARSCMTDHNSCHTLLYEDNPDKFSMLIMKFGADSARAIVHLLDSGRYLLDRVYGSSEHLKDKMQDYAREKGWLYRELFSPESSEVLDGDEIYPDADIRVSGLIFEEGGVPYQDTLTGGIISDGLLTITYACNTCDYTLDSTCGELEAGSACCICEERLSEVDEYYYEGNVHCQECYDELYETCESCCDAVSVDDMVSIDNGDIYVCESCAEKDHHYCDDCNSWYSNGQHLEGLEKTVCGECLENYTFCEGCDEYHSDNQVIYVDDANCYVCDSCLEKDFDQCAGCSQYYHNDSLTENDEGELICEDCAE